MVAYYKYVEEQPARAGKNRETSVAARILKFAIGIYCTVWVYEWGKEKSVSI
jgi:hypothetical protein